MVDQYCNIVYGQCNGRVLCRETACTCPVVHMPRYSTLAMAAAAWIAQVRWDRGRSRTCSMCAADTVHAWVPNLHQARHEGIPGPSLILTDKCHVTSNCNPRKRSICNHVIVTLH